MVGEVALEDTDPWQVGPDPELGELLARELSDLRLDWAVPDAASLVAALAQHWQIRAGVTRALWGVAARSTERYSATLYFGCTDPYLGEKVLSLAVQLVRHLTQSSPSPDELTALLERCATAADAAGLDQSTRLMIEAAERRGIPWFRMTRRSRHIQLGQGKRQNRIRETLLGNEGAIGRELAQDKLVSLSTLAQVRIPVGNLAAIDTVENALKAAEAIGYPLVLKPISGMKGVSVHANLRNPVELRAAAVAARIHERPFLLQSFFPGADHRLLVVGGKLIAAAQRICPTVTGDGRHTIRELVENENLNPLRGPGFSKLMNLIVLDGDSDRVLAMQGLTRASIPESGRTVTLKLVANIAAGGSAVA
jgi:cyanophycin synthetase